MRYNLKFRKLTLYGLRAIFQESEAKLEMKNFNPPFIFCVEVGYLGG